MGLCEGPRVPKETRPDASGHGLTFVRRLTLEPERQPNRRTSTGGKYRRSHSFPSDAQAACGFKCSGLKRSPFFQRVSATVASLRAITRCASWGAMPSATRRA